MHPPDVAAVKLTLDEQLHRAAQRALLDELFVPQNLHTGSEKLDAEAWNELAASHNLRDLLLAWDKIDLPLRWALDEDLCELLSVSRDK